MFSQSFEIPDDNSMETVQICHANNIEILTPPPFEPQPGLKKRRKNNFIQII